MASLVVVVIVGGVMAAITWMTIATDKPATSPEPRPIAPARTPEPPRPTAPPQPTARAEDLVELRISWWRRLRAALGLSALGAALGLGLAGLVGLALLVTVLALDRALG